MNPQEIRLLGEIVELSHEYIQDECDHEYEDVIDMNFSENITYVAYCDKCQHESEAECFTKRNEHEDII